MTNFLAAALAMTICLVPCGVVCRRGRLWEAVVGYELASTIVVMVLVLLAQGFGRSGEFELAVLLAVLLPGSALVFVRVMERWL